MDKDFRDLIKNAQKNFRQFDDAVKNINYQLQPLFDRIREIQERVNPVIRDIQRSFQEIYQQSLLLDKGFTEVIEQAKKWQLQQKQNVTHMAEKGWFPNELTFNYEPKSTELGDLDRIMIGHLQRDREVLKQQIVERCPERKHILQVAFDLHEAGNYIASIPLFLTQSDGIFFDGIEIFFFQGKKQWEKLKKLLDEGKVKNGFFQDILLEPFKIDIQYKKKINRASITDKEKGPNRPGIMHGYRKHLDYGTEINSLKCFSLLAFIVFATKDVFSENK